MVLSLNQSGDSSTGSCKEDISTSKENYSSITPMIQ